MFKNGVKKIIFQVAVLLLLVFVTQAKAATDTAEYQILATTQGGVQAMQAPLTMQLDARGTPVKGSPEEASHFIPPGMKMGDALPLIRPDAPQGRDNTTPGMRDNTEMWTMKIYWGCSTTVQKGQPIVISPQDVKSGKGEWAKLANTGGGVWKSAPPKGWGWGQWPNKKSSIPVPSGASLKGSHRVEGNYLPQIKFDMANHDFLPALDVKAGGGDLNASIPLSWSPVKGAVGYFMYAMASNPAKKETIIWTSSSKPAMGMMMHEHSSKIKELVKSGIVLGADKAACNIPAGIFAGCEGAMVMGSAWGEDYSMSYPPKPANAPKNWKPDWVVNALFLTTWMGMPGMDIPMMSGGMNFEIPDDAYDGGDYEEESNKPGGRGGRIPIPFPIF